MARVPGTWREVLQDELRQPYLRDLADYVAEERARYPIYPADEHVFAALEHADYDAVRVVILGQDPYHGPNQAHGLSFSVPPGVPHPPSLLNIFKELRDDLGCPIPRHGTLTRWAEQGVLLLNAVLTVRAGQAGSHAGKGWERLTDAIIQTLSAREQGAVFVLWGRYAQQKRSLIDTSRHGVIASAHPSPLSAHNGFFGSRPFSQVNAALERMGQQPIDWCLE
jgi:uracil-DNA glycosylase